MSKWPHQSDVDSFYGNPRGIDGEAGSKWVKANIIGVSPPWQLVTAWDHAPVSKIRVHKKCSESLFLIFEKIWISANQDQRVGDEPFCWRL